MVIRLRWDVVDAMAASIRSPGSTAVVPALTPIVTRRSSVVEPTVR
jgi:hypothetical protein